MNPSVPHRDALKDVIAGKVVLSGSPGHDSVRKPANARFHDMWSRAVVLASMRKCKRLEGLTFRAELSTNGAEQLELARA